MAARWHVWSGEMWHLCLYISMFYTTRSVTPWALCFDPLSSCEHVRNVVLFSLAVERTLVCSLWVVHLQINTSSGERFMYLIGDIQSDHVFHCILFCFAFSNKSVVERPPYYSMYVFSRFLCCKNFWTQICEVNGHVALSCRNHHIRCR